MDSLFLRRRLPQVCLLMVGFLRAGTLPPASEARGLTLCTQNLWNYGSSKDVHDLRRSKVPIEKVRRDLARQEQALVERMTGCDIIAVQELVGRNQANAANSLEVLASALSKRSGHPYRFEVAASEEPIHNGFLIRSDSGLFVLRFDGGRSGESLPILHGYPSQRWQRAPAEIVVLRPAASGRAAIDLRIFSAHFKSKVESGRRTDPSQEHWERRRVAEANGLRTIVLKCENANPAEPIFVLGDFNGGAGSAARAVLSGSLSAVQLLFPKDCIGPQGDISCRLEHLQPDLFDLAGDDPDLGGAGTIRFQGKDDLIDGIFANANARRLAQIAGRAPSDVEIEAIGRIGEGSDHRMLRILLP